jgi:hypothetical protein
MTSPQQGIDSGFLPVAAGATEFPSWSFSISNATTPLWFYCKQKSPAKYKPISNKSQVPALMPHFFYSHCQAGMVFAINPTADKSFDAFQVCWAFVKHITPWTKIILFFQAAAKASGSSTTGSGGYGSGSTTTSGGSSTSTAATGNGAIKMSGSAVSILAVAGLVAGLVL